MFSQGLLTDLERQQKYVYDIHKDGAPCPVCGKIQPPWEAADQDVKVWLMSQTERKYHCVECNTELRHDVYLMGGWGWGNPAVKAHR